MSVKPVIAITMGDPAGIGPEVTAKALAHDEVWDCCRPLVVGAAAIMRQMTRWTAKPLAFRSISQPQQAIYSRSSPDVLDIPNIDPATLQPGQVSATAGQASVEYIRRAVELAKLGQADALATGPVNKAALKAAGIPFIGHTELLSALLGEERVTTMLATEGLRVVHVTRHVPLAKVAALITRDNVLETIRITHTGMQKMGFSRPRLAVAAINPHGGDEGLMGREEIDAIAPAVEIARAEGIDASGPIPADSIFFRAIRDEFDVVVAMYHDQGHIPIKTHGFERSITVTLGLPVVRTSVDHGTAFDIAWRGIASEESMIEAICLAAKLVGDK